MENVLNQNNILFTYKEDYQKEYLNLLKEALKEKDFIKSVAYANQKDFFYSDYNPYYFYNKRYDAHIYYKYIYDVDEIGEYPDMYAKKGTYIKNKNGILFNQHIEMKMLKKRHLVYIISYYPNI
jgi:hypothetical protein